jgi:ribosome recycling factor
MEPELKRFTEQLDGFVGRFRQELLALRGDRPSAKMFEDIAVEYYDKKIPVKQLGMVTVVPPRDVMISVWDEGATKAIAKAIEEANLGVTPNTEKTTIRMTLPPLTDERRREIIKVVGKVAENYRIHVRTAREEINKKIDRAKAENAIADDARFRYREKVQQATDVANKEIERLTEQKETEIRA